MERRRLLIALATVLLSINGKELVVEAQENCTSVTAPSAPQNVTASAVSFSCVNVSWTAPTSAGGGSAVITRYNITWNGGSHIVEDGTSTSYQVMGLTQGTNYSFTVTAENNCNNMSEGATAMATTGAVPAVTNVTAQAVSSSAITVQWVYSTPACGDVDSFVVTYSRDNGTDMMMNVTEVSSRSVDITDLADMQGTYSISVKAVYQSVTSADSNTVAIIFRTPPPPGNVTATANSSSTIAVTWTPPVVSANRPPVTGYTVTAVPSGGSTPVQLPASATSTELSGLVRATSYTISVVAQSVVGDSPAGNDTAMTFMMPPSPPRNVTLVAASPDSIAVSWTMPSNNGGSAVVRYNVTLKRGGVTEQTMSPTSESTSFTELMEGVVYTVEVVAVNGVGNSNATTGTIDFSVPPPPTGVTATATSGSSINVSWTAPVIPDGSPPVTGYTVTGVPSGGSPRVENTTTTTSTVLNGLQENTTYTISVVAHNAVGGSVPGNTSGRTFGRTSRPQDLKLFLLSDSSITVQWMEPAHDGGSPVGSYSVTLQGGPGAVTRTLTSRSTTFAGLVAPNTYTVEVTAVNKAGPGPPATGNIVFQVPAEPTITDLTASSTALTVTWTNTNTSIEVDSYDVAVLNGNSQVADRRVESSVTTATLDVTDKGVTYIINVTAVNKVGSSSSASRMLYFAVPGKPQNVSVEAVSATELDVSWTAPTTPPNSAPVTGYTVYWRAAEGGMESSSANTTTTAYQITGLDLGTEYTVNVTAHNSVGESDVGIGSGTTFNVPSSPQDLIARAKSHTEVSVTWKPPQSDGGTPITMYNVTYSMVDGGLKWQDVTGSNDMDPPTSTEIKGLSPQTEYNISVYAINVVDASEPAVTVVRTAATPLNAAVIGAAAGGSLAVICLLAVVVIVCLIVWRKKRTRIKLSRGRSPRQMKVWDSGAQFTDTIRMAIHGEGANLSGSQQDLIGGQEESPLSTPVLGRKELTPSHPVSLDSFVGYIESTPREELIAQYRSIPNKTHDLMALALMNPLSNRYINILPYDKNRVVLSEPNSDGNDYINASYINSYDKENSFIAAQGPLQRTADDFWQMVWDQKATVVVMLTKCMEGTKSKCAEYFPRNVGGRVFIKMNIAVENKSMHVFKDYEIRMLEVKNCKADITRTVQHFYYIGWPDFGVPDSPTGVLTMLHHVRAIRRSGDPDVPSIIHCSAGVGRTGTFIALDHLVQQVQTEGDNAMIDIEALVSTMRTQRGTMVQASEQYVFIHRALREYLLLGYTMMSGPDLKAKVEEMSPVKRHSGISHFQEQYERLEYITAPYTKAPKVAEEFLSKIRFPDKGPYEGKYIRITPVAGDFSSSFVNASLVDGYRQTKQFIVAQSPMHSTTGDFWALVYEKRCPTVVLLCAFQENGEESSVRFWPSEVGNTENFFGYKVTCKSEDVSSSFTTLQLVVQPEGEDLSPLEVTLYHLDDWSAATMPSSGSVLSLLDTARAGQRKGSTPPVVVACNDGLGRSCLFVSLWVLTEQLATEDQVDVVGTFKSVRSSRPGAMDSLDYFIHCYHILVQYREIHNPTPEDSGYV